MADPDLSPTVTVRLPPEVNRRLEALRLTLAGMGATARRATVACDALIAGLDVLEARFKGPGLKRARGARP